MSSESNYSFTTKVSGDLFTVRGDNAEEFKANLQNILSLNVLDDLTALQEEIAADKRPSGAAPAPASVNNLQATFGDGVKPISQPTEAPQEGVSTFNGLASTPTCDHGPRKWNEGVSKAGNPYRGWFCQQTDRSQQCKPMFVNNK